MILKPITINIEEDSDTGYITIDIFAPRTEKLIRSETLSAYPLGMKVEMIGYKIKDMLADLEENKEIQKEEDVETD